MKRNVFKPMIFLAAILFLSMNVLEMSAHARVGGSRSMGSRGSRSYSQPSTPATRPVAPRQQAAAPPIQPQQQGGGFLRSMAGGMVGGMLGGMLFRSLGFAGPGGGMGGGGIGLFEILLLAGIGYLIYRFIKKRSAGSAAPYDQYDQGRTQGGYQAGTAIPSSTGYIANEPAADDADAGLAHIRQMDSSFDEQRFNDMVMDHFFKIQGAWMNRDLSTASLLLTEEMKRIFQEDMNRLLQEKKTNRLENIAVRNVEVTEAWQESGQDYITVLIYANLLDYTTDDTTGAVVSGSKTDPVKFEEYWTFTRPVGNNSWRLSAIAQV